MLTPQQVEQFEADGYLILDPCLEEGEVDVFVPSYNEDIAILSTLDSYKVQVKFGPQQLNYLTSCTTQTWSNG